ncbi:MAG: acetyl-CoA carboxylase carboxyl transferase subunit beta [Armatimonadia bacterium]|nr:acetyl-CoA carboxylase carboxyl transferase subunit beta [Armatimonadia bacterium]
MATERDWRARVPDGMWVKCENPSCAQLLYKKELDRNLMVCSQCGYHFRLSARQRIDITLDPDSFEETDTELVTLNPLGMEGYEQKLKRHRARTGEMEAAVVGTGTIIGKPVTIGITNPFFTVGSMGSVVGEKMARCVERAGDMGCPCILISGSGAGARMEEGILSLMQMAKTSAAIGRLREAGQLCVTILTNPTMAGVYASWASLGDMILAEPGAMVGFAGQRVVKGTKSGLGAEAQSAEFQHEHGMVDRIVPRPEMRTFLERVVRMTYAAPLRREVPLEV